MKVSECHDQIEWDKFVLAHGGHPLQLWGWGEVKRAHHWSARRIFLTEDDTTIAVQILRRRLPAPLHAIWYVPRGPVAKNEADLMRGLGMLERYGTSLDGIVLRIEPESTLESLPSPWQRSHDTVLMAETLVLDLSKSQDELQAEMAKKTRQYIRKSGRDVSIRKLSPDEIDACYAIYKDTAQRAGFGLHSVAYYQDVYKYLGDASVLYGAFEGEELLSFLWLARTPYIAFELYGGMSERGQALRSNYALKWHAICDSQTYGCSRYDFNGLVSESVSTFKTGFSSTATELVGTYELPLSSWYFAWNIGFRPAKKVLQKLRR